MEALRSEEMLAKPVWVEPAFDDAEAVMALVRASAPYRLSAHVHKTDDDGRDVPWFRVFWAHTGKLREPAARDLFYNERFIEAAKQSFGAKVVIPNALMTNHNAPMGSGLPHLDLPFFRGALRFPFWLLVAMGYSGLFHRWAIPIASTITWFNRGEGGDFEYWPDGPDAASTHVTTPAWNVGVVADNEYMWHRVGPVGEAAERLAPGTIQRDAQLHAHGDGSWTIRDGAGFERRFAEDQVRHSILWKAYAFEDDAAYKAFQDHSDDLSYAKTVEIFNADLARRGVSPVDTSDPAHDPAWKQLIQTQYKPRHILGGERPDP